MEKRELEATLISVIAHLSEMMTEETRERMRDDMLVWHANSAGHPVFAPEAWKDARVKRVIQGLWEEHGANEHEPAPARMPTLRSAR